MNLNENHLKKRTQKQKKTKIGKKKKQNQENQKNGFEQNLSAAKRSSGLRRPWCDKMS